MLVQLHEEHYQRILLPLVERRQEGRPLRGHQRAGAAHGELFVHILEQPVERKDNEDEEHAPDHIGEHAGFEEQLVRGDVGGGRGRIIVDEQLVGDVKEC